MKINRMMGAMVGLAVGDALGVPVEFKDSKYIHEQYGVLDKMVGGGTWGQEAGTISDDTEMALAVAEGIINNPSEPVKPIGDRFIKWYSKRPFDVGVCCASVINNAIQNGRDWFSASQLYDYRSGGRSGGNGGIMRTAFVGVFYRTLTEVKEHAREICSMTHWNKDARNDCALVSMIIHSLIEGGDKNTIEDLVMSFPEEREKRYNLGVIEGYPFRVNPSGSSRNSLACALKCVLTTQTFKDAVVMAVNMGGDTDTIGAITGAIAGALYGEKCIPKDWISCLDDDVKDRIAVVLSKAALHRLGDEVCKMFVMKDYVDGNKKRYQKGMRIVLDEDMNDDSDFRPMKGDKGTVIFVDDMGTVHVEWDSGSTLGVIPGHDNFHVEV